MKISSVTTKRYTREELIKLIQDTFKDFDEFETIGVITQISEYKGDKVQTLVLARNLEI